MCSNCFWMIKEIVDGNLFCGENHKIAKSKVDARPDLQALQISRDAKHHGLRDICTDIDSTPGTHVSAGCKVSTAEAVSKTLEVMEEDPHRKNNVVELYGGRLHGKDSCYVHVSFYMYYIYYVCAFLQTINKL